MPVQTETTLKARMSHPAFVVPDAMQALQALGEATKQSGLAQSIRDMVCLRISQINGCSVCVDMHARDMKRGGESFERIVAVVAWRDNPAFTSEERAALALAEATTRLSDQADPVPDDIWNEAARHFDEKALAGLLLTIANINVWNRLNVAIRQVAGAWKG
ncbi:MAG: carboxymuconolactone decarboxylase family protein [Terracidiphilus sp.]